MSRVPPAAWAMRDGGALGSGEGGTLGLAMRRLGQLAKWQISD